MTANRHMRNRSFMYAGKHVNLHTAGAGSKGRALYADVKTQFCTAAYDTCGTKTPQLVHAFISGGLHA